MNTIIKSNSFEVIIIGGSYAGLSAAMALGRSLRHVLVIDSGLPCNRQTPHSQNFLTRDGSSPKEIATIAKEQVARYDTIRFVDGIAVRGEKSHADFEIEVETGEKFTGKKLLLATGIKDLMPDIKGFAACWGISVIHCPYCHGYEFAGKNTGLLASGERALHLAGLVNNLTKELVLLTNGKPDFDNEQLSKLKKAGVAIADDAISEIIHENGYVKSVLFSNGDEIVLEAIYAAIPFEQQSLIPGSLGCELTVPGYINIDGFQKTNVPGVFACGDNSSGLRSVANAVAAGNKAGAMINMELVGEQF